MLPVSPEILKTIVDTGEILGKPVVGGTVGYTVYVAGSQICEAGADYSSPHIVIPLIVAILTGIWACLNIYDKVDQIRSRKSEKA